MGLGQDRLVPVASTLKRFLSYNSCHDDFERKIDYLCCQSNINPGSLAKNMGRGHRNYKPRQLFAYTVEPPAATTSPQRPIFQNTKRFRVKSL